MVLSKTAYPAAAFVSVPECNVCQDTIAVRVAHPGIDKLKTGFIVAYLNGRYGTALMQRQFQGNVQLHCHCLTERNSPSRFLGMDCNRCASVCARCQLRHGAKQEDSGDAEGLLLRALGLGAGNLLNR